MKKILLSCVTILFCFSVMAQSSVDLKLNLEKNKVYRLRSLSEQTIAQTVNGNQQTTDSRTNYTVSMKMMDATPDFMITEVRFDTLISKTNTMGKTTLISSAIEGDIKSTETADVMSCIMNRLSKNALYAKMDFTGKVIEIVNSKMLSDIVLKDTSSIALSGPIAAAVKMQIKNLVGDNSLKNMIEMFTHYLPGKQVSTGDDWKVIQKMNSGGMLLSIVTTHHLDKIQDHTANVTAESEIKAADDAAPIVTAGAKITYDDLKGLGKSTMTVDTQTGLVVEHKGKTHITGNLGISGPGFSMQMPMDINGETIISQLQ